MRTCCAESLEFEVRAGFEVPALPDPPTQSRETQTAAPGPRRKKKSPRRRSAPSLSLLRALPFRFTLGSGAPGAGAVAPVLDAAIALACLAAAAFALSWAYGLIARPPPCVVAPARAPRAAGGAAPPVLLPDLGIVAEFFEVVEVLQRMREAVPPSAGGL